MKTHHRQFGWRIAIAALAIAGWLGVAPSFAQTQLPDDQPETVLVTFHVQPGHEEDMKKVLVDAWKAYTRLDMVLQQPHVIVQGSENGRPYFAEILTWKDRNIPDHMPAEVQTIWKHMDAICEKRGDKPPIDGGEVQLIVPRP